MNERMRHQLKRKINEARDEKIKKSIGECPDFFDAFKKIAKYKNSKQLYAKLDEVVENTFKKRYASKDSTIYLQIRDLVTNLSEIEKEYEIGKAAYIAKLKSHEKEINKITDDAEKLKEKVDFTTGNKLALQLLDEINTYKEL